MSSTPYAVTAASSSLANVPVNVVNMVMSIPAWEIQAMGRLADAMIATGSWQVWGPTNVFGFDEEDPPKLAALIDMLIPIQPFSSVLGDQLSWWARANLPMNAGCAAAQNACPDPKAMLDSMFRASPADFYRGYQFPAVTNPFTGVEASWSGQFVKLDRNAAVNSLRDYLTAPPAGVATVTSAEAVGSISRLAKSVNDAFHPFVQNSQWFDDQHTPLAPLFRALAPVLCASCDPTNPYDNEWLKNYPQKPAAAKPSAAVPAAATVASPAVSAERDLGFPQADPIPQVEVSPGAAEHGTPAVETAHSTKAGIGGTSRHRGGREEGKAVSWKGPRSAASAGERARATSAKPGRARTGQGT